MARNKPKTERKPEQRTEAQRAALVKAQAARRTNKARLEADAARIRAWHVALGHNVTNPTAEERAIIEAARERIRGT